MFVKIHFILYCGNLSYWNYIWWRQTSLNMMCNITWELFLLCKSSVPLCCSDHCYCHSEKTCASKDKQLLVSTGFTNESRLTYSYSNYITVGNEHFTPRSTLFCLLTFLKVETKYKTKLLTFHQNSVNFIMKLSWSVFLLFVFSESRITNILDGGGSRLDGR